MLLATWEKEAATSTVMLMCACEFPSDAGVTALSLRWFIFASKLIVYEDLQHKFSSWPLIWGKFFYLLLTNIATSHR